MPGEQIEMPDSLRHREIRFQPLGPNKLDLRRATTMLYKE